MDITCPTLVGERPPGGMEIVVPLVRFILISSAATALVVDCLKLVKNGCFLGVDAILRAVKMILRC